MPFSKLLPAPPALSSTGRIPVSQTSKTLAAVLVSALVVLIGNGLLSWWNLCQLTANESNVAHTQEVRVHIKELLPLLFSCESALRWKSVAGSDELLKDYDGALPCIRHDMATLDALTADNPHQQIRLRHLQELLVETFPALNDLDVSLRGSAFQTSLAEAASGRSRQRLAEMKTLLEEMDGEELRLLQQRGHIADRSVRISQVTLCVSTALGIAFLGLLSSLTLRDAYQRHHHALTLADAVRRKDESLALLDTLLDTAPVGLAFLDREFRYVRINNALAAINGLRGAEHLGRSVREIVPHLWPRLEPLYRSVLETGQPILDCEIQGETIHTPGDLRHWLVSYYPVHLGSNTILGIGAIISDVTERKRADEALRLSEWRWRQLADAMPQIVWTARPDGEVDYFNRRWYEFTGFDTSTVPGDSWSSILHPDDLALCLATWYHAVRTGETYQIEYRFRDAQTGNYRWHLGRAFPVRDEQGDIVRWYGTCTDIHDQKCAEEEVRSLNENLERRVLERTEQLASSNLRLEQENRERQRAEEERGRMADEFRLLLDSSGEGIYGLDGEGRCTFINRVAAELLGGTPEAFTGREMHQLIHHTHSDGTPSAAADCPVYQAYRIGFACRISDDVFWRLDGSSFPVEYSSRPLLDDGRPRGAVVTFTNIAERQKRVRELREAKEAAEAANRAKSEFLANMSHEIRTPMNGILGMTALTLETDLRPEQREFLDTVRSSAEALLGLLNDILDFSKIEAGKLDLDPRPFRLRPALDEMLKPLVLRAHDKGLELAYQVDPNVPEVLIGDWGRLRQILINLVGNALKFTHEGMVRVQVGVDQKACAAVGGCNGSSSPSSVCVSFQVQDSGIGIAREKLGVIFDPFVQADGSMARQFGGSGLGLAISKRLTQLLGGRLGVESELGKGSTFHFHVRLATADDVTERLGEVPLEPRLPPLRILLTEDNRINQRLGVALLTKRGHTVEVAANGKLALEALAERSFDVVLMDVQMPEMDGFEATARIRQRELGTERRTPIIALTAHAIKGDRERCLDAGMDGYVSKPLQPAVLLCAIRDVLLCEAVS